MGCYNNKKMFKNSLLIYAPLRDFGGMWRCKDMGYSKLTYEEYIENPDVWSMTPPKWASELSAKGYRLCADKVVCKRVYEVKRVLLN